MKVYSAINLFLEHLSENKTSNRVYRSYQCELERLNTFLVKKCAKSFKDERITELFNSYFQKRTAGLSENYRKKIAYRFNRFFNFLHEQRIVTCETIVLFHYSTQISVVSPHKSLLHEIRELKKIYDKIDQIRNIKDQISKIKKHVISVANEHTKFETLLSASFDKEIKNVKQNANKILNSQLNELIQIGTFFTQKDILNLKTEISDLAKNISKYGRESYKANTLFEAKQIKDDQLFQDLQNRLIRTEKIIEELLALKQRANLQLIKNLLPVVDGINEALEFFPDQNELSELNNLHKKDSFLQKLFSQIKPEIDHKTKTLDTLRQGLDIIYQRLLSVLSQENVHPIKSNGERFDPRYHIAVGVENRNDVEESTIVRENLKGYCRGKEVIRYAEVIVAKKKD